MENRPHHERNRKGQDVLPVEPSEQSPEQTVKVSGKQAEQHPRNKAHHDRSHRIDREAGRAEDIDPVKAQKSEALHKAGDTKSQTADGAAFRS